MSARKKFSLHADDEEYNDVGKSMALFQSEQSYSMQFIPVDKIVVNELNSMFAQTEIEKLKLSIIDIGLEHNLVVLRDGDEYRLISGERRYRAIKMILEENPEYPAFAAGIPCKVISGIDKVEEEIRLIRANTDIRELSQEERRQAVLRLLQLYKIRKQNGDISAVQRQLAEDLNLSLRQVQRYAATEKLGPELDKLVKDGVIRLEDAARYAVLELDLQAVIAELYKSRGKVTAEEVEELKRVKQEKEEIKKQLETELDHSRKKTEELESKLDSKEDEIRALQASMDNPESDLERIVTEKKLAESQAELLRKQKAAAEEKCKELKKQLSRPMDVDADKLKKIKATVRLESALNLFEQNFEIVKRDYQVASEDPDLRNRLVVLTDRFVNLLNLMKLPLNIEKKEE